MCNYLTNLPTEVCNETGLSKTLITRRDTIYLKHIFKNLFVYNTEEETKELLDDLNMTLFQYNTYMANKLRGIYKYTREFTSKNADDIVKCDVTSFCKTITLYKPLDPLIILDYDRTITNKNFHSLFYWLKENKFRMIINTANPNVEVIQAYLQKHNLPKVKIVANKGKQAKIKSLKDLFFRSTRNPVFYIDDQLEYLKYGCILGGYCYQYKGSKIHYRTIFKK